MLCLPAACRYADDGDGPEGTSTLAVVAVAATAAAAVMTYWLSRTGCAAAPERDYGPEKKTRQYSYSVPQSISFNKIN